MLNKADYYLTRDLDTEVIMHYLSYELRGDDRPDLVEVFSNLSQKFDGAYNLVFMNGMGDMVSSAIPMAFGRCAMPSKARCSPRRAKASP